MNLNETTSGSFKYSNGVVPTKQEVNAMTFIGAFRAKDGMVLVADSRLILDKIYGKYQDSQNKVFEIKSKETYILCGGKIPFFITLLDNGFFSKFSKDELNFPDLDSISKKLSEMVTQHIRVSPFQDMSIEGYILHLVFASKNKKIYSINFSKEMIEFTLVDNTRYGYVVYSPLWYDNDRILEENEIIKDYKMNENLTIEEVKTKINAVYKEITKTTFHVGGEMKTVTIPFE